MGQLGDLSPEGSVAIGIVVGLLSTSIQSLGLTLQRKSHLLEDEKPAPETRRPPYKRGRWQLGMLMFVVSNVVGSTIQITTLPLPVLSTLQASGLVFNTAFATLLLKEPFTRYSLIGTILTCAGAALIATFGAVAEPAHSLEQLLQLMWRKPFVIWMIATFVVVVGTIAFTHLLKSYSSHIYLSRFLGKQERPRSASRSDVRNRRQSITTQLPRPLQLRVGRLRLIRGLSYALVSGILSAHSLLVAKSAVELLVRTIVDHNNQFNRFQSWLILLALLFFALSQLYYLHLGLRLCSTSVLYPFVFCIYNIIAILDGLIYFHQTSRLTALHGGLIGLGTAILLSGVLALSWRLDDATPTEPAAEIMPQTTLAPGMGIVRSPADGERSPLLPTSRSRSRTSLPALDESTPLLFKRRARTDLSGQPRISKPLRTTGSATRDIWAELDDDGNDDTHDFLASLSQSPPLQMSNDNLSIVKRRRGASLSKSTTGERLAYSPDLPKSARFTRRSQTLQTGRRVSHDAYTSKTSRLVNPTDDADEDDKKDIDDRPKRSSSRVHFQDLEIRSKSSHDSDEDDESLGSESAARKNTKTEQDNDR